MLERLRENPLWSLEDGEHLPQVYEVEPIPSSADVEKPVLLNVIYNKLDILRYPAGLDGREVDADHLGARELLGDFDRPGR